MKLERSYIQFTSCVDNFSNGSDFCPARIFTGRFSPEQAYGIFEQSCLLCHGDQTVRLPEQITIDYTSAEGLIASGVGCTGETRLISELYQRACIERRDQAKRMPLRTARHSQRAAINTIRRWILAGAPSWADAGR